MNSILISFILCICKIKNSKVIEEVINLEDNVVYNVKTDGRGGIEIKSKNPNENEWSSPKKLNVHENAGQLLENGALILKTEDENFILAYAPKPEDFQNQPVQPNYKIDEYNKMANDENTKEAFYKTEPKFVEGVQTEKKSTYYDYKPTQQQKIAASKPPKKKAKKEKKEKKDDDNVDEEESEPNGVYNLVPYISTCIMWALFTSF